jgi:hypothetical protein
LLGKNWTRRDAVGQTETSPSLGVISFRIILVLDRHILALAAVGAVKM